jgi:hypothetical protein
MRKVSRPGCDASFYFRRDFDLIGASMMHGGAIVRSRKIKIIKNAPMFLVPFPADSA